jgi:hypothetical protein
VLHVAHRRRNRRQRRRRRAVLCRFVDSAISRRSAVFVTTAVSPVAGRSSLNAVVSTPLAEWKFDRNRTSLLDSSGNGFHSTIRGPLVFRQENGVAYLHCHGANDVINFPNTTFDGFGLRSFAFEAKLRFTSTDLMIIRCETLQRQRRRRRARALGHFCTRRTSGDRNRG